jgi:PAS domain S-box-containing protein
MNSALILVVDDEESNRYFFSHLLKKNGYQVLVASSGQEALSLVNNKPDLILLDVNLPDVFGFEVARILKQNVYFKNIPIIQTSASFTQGTDHMKGIDSGADAYISSPVDPLVLLSTIKAWLRIFKAEQEKEKLQGELMDAKQRSHFELESIFKDSPDAMAFWYGEDLVFKKLNPKYQSTFGDRELLGRPLREALPEICDQGFHDLILEVLRTGVALVGKEVLAQVRSSKDGPFEKRYYDFAFQQVKDVDGNPYGVFNHAIDVTDRVMASQSLKVAKLNLENTIKSLEQERKFRENFVAALSHDLRTPLTAAKLSAQVLAKKNPDALAHRIISSMDRADGMIRDMLDATKIKAGELIHIEPKDCVLNEILDETISELSTVHGERFILKTDKTVRGYWDCKVLRRVLENLASNAVKYGTPLTPVTIELSASETSAEISVHNLGNPIPLEEQNSIFEPYKRTLSATSGTQKGWGIGLTLVRGFIEAHQGNAVLKSSSTEGTTFLVTMPLDVRHEL